MNKPISDLTYKVVALSEFNKEADINDSIDWALEMMELGHEAPSLYILAGLSKPVNYFEVISYLTNALRELGIEMKSGQDAVISYAGYYAHQIAKGSKMRENLEKLYKFCLSREYDKLVYDFFLLYWAWDQLDWEDLGNNHYWEGVTKSNIEQVVIDEAKKWIAKNNIKL